jgi:prophage tail gpP-like protein
MNLDAAFTLTVNGQRYERWEEIRVTREIDRMATDFNIAVSERYLGSAQITGSSPVTGVPLGPFQDARLP